MIGFRTCRVALRVSVIANVLAAALAGLVGFAEARITHIVVTSTTPAFGGVSFGSVGPYENLVGTATGELDPGDPLNAVITDLERAPRNASGNVIYSMDFSIFKPVDTSKGNHI